MGQVDWRCRKDRLRPRGFNRKVYFVTDAIGIPIRVLAADGSRVNWSKAIALTGKLPRKTLSADCGSLVPTKSSNMQKNRVFTRLSFPKEPQNTTQIRWKHCKKLCRTEKCILLFKIFLCPVPTRCVEKFAFPITLLPLVIFYCLARSHTGMFR